MYLLLGHSTVPPQQAGNMWVVQYWIHPYASPMLLDLYLIPLWPFLFQNVWLCFPSTVSLSNRPGPTIILLQFLNCTPNFFSKKASMLSLHGHSPCKIQVPNYEWKATSYSNRAEACLSMVSTSAGDLLGAQGLLVLYTTKTQDKNLI